MRLKHQNQPGLAGSARSDGHDIPGAVPPFQEKECLGPDAAAAGVSQQANVPVPQGSTLGPVIVIIDSDRDRRTLAWLVQKFGSEAVQEKAGSLAGARKPYVSNIAHALGVTPAELKDLACGGPGEEIRKQMRDLRRRLGERGGHRGDAGGGGGLPPTVPARAHGSAHDDQEGGSYA